MRAKRAGKRASVSELVRGAKRPEHERSESEEDRARSALASHSQPTTPKRGPSHIGRPSHCVSPAAGGRHQLQPAVVVAGRPPGGISPLARSANRPTALVSSASQPTHRRECTLAGGRALCAGTGLVGELFTGAHGHCGSPAQYALGTACGNAGSIRRLRRFGGPSGPGPHELCGLVPFPGVGRRHQRPVGCSRLSACALRPSVVARLTTPLT